MSRKINTEGRHAVGAVLISVVALAAIITFAMSRSGTLHPPASEPAAEEIAEEVPRYCYGLLPEGETDILTARRRDISCDSSTLKACQAKAAQWRDRGRIIVPCQRRIPSATKAWKAQEKERTPTLHVSRDDRTS